MDGRGFTAETWSALKTFQGRCASPHDVDLGAAVFALGDTFNGKPLDLRLPQPVIWWSDDEDEVGAVAVQAGEHRSPAIDVRLPGPDGSAPALPPMRWAEPYEQAEEVA